MLLQRLIYSRKRYCCLSHTLSLFLFVGCLLGDNGNVWNRISLVVINSQAWDFAAQRGNFVLSRDRRSRRRVCAGGGARCGGALTRRRIRTLRWAFLKRSYEARLEKRCRTQTNQRRLFCLTCNEPTSCRNMNRLLLITVSLLMLFVFSLSLWIKKKPRWLFYFI